MNSEIANKGFLSRLQLLIGVEKPYPWAAKVGITQATFNRMWKDGIAPKADILLLISEKTGCSIDWLLIGEGDMWRPGFGPEIDRMVAAADRIESLNAFINGKSRTLQEQYPLNPLSKSFNNEEFVQIPRYEVAASAGGGTMIHSEQIVDHLSFKSDWVRNALGIPVSALALINVTGDSMEPTLSEGDLILIDMSHRGVKDNAVYVLQLNGTLLVKRIQHKLDGSVIVKSDNAIYEPELVGSEAVDFLNIIGRVVWCGRRM